MSSVCKREKFLGRGQRLFWLESSSGQTDLHLCLAKRNHTYSWQREVQHLWSKGSSSTEMITLCLLFKGRVQFLQPWQVSHWSTSPQKRCCCSLRTVWGAHKQRKKETLIYFSSFFYSPVCSQGPVLNHYFVQPWAQHSNQFLWAPAQCHER